MFPERSRGSALQSITTSSIWLHRELRCRLLDGSAFCVSRSRTTSDLEILRAWAWPAISKKRQSGNFTVKVFIDPSVIRFQHFRNTRSRVRVGRSNSCNSCLVMVRVIRVFTRLRKATVRRENVEARVASGNNLNGSMRDARVECC